MSVIIKKKWAMPSGNTFSIKPIGDLIARHLAGKSIDPFANNNKLATITNDIDIDCAADYHMDAIDFLKSFESASIDVVLFDPPYSPRQVSECYKAMNMTVNMQTTQASFWTKMKKEISRIVRPGGKVITCGWNSGGVGKSLGFRQVEILLVAHGGWHNDTIITVEIKNE